MTLMDRAASIHLKIGTVTIAIKQRGM